MGCCWLLAWPCFRVYWYWPDYASYCISSVFFVIRLGRKGEDEEKDKKVFYEVGIPDHTAS